VTTSNLGRDNDHSNFFVFFCSPSSLNSQILPQITQRPLRFTSFSIHNSLITLLFNTMQPELTAMLLTLKSLVVTTSTTSFDIKNCYLLPTICFWLSEQVIFPLYNINCLVFTIDISYVYCAVRTESLTKFRLVLVFSKLTKQSMHKPYQFDFTLPTPNLYLFV